MRKRLTLILATVLSIAAVAVIGSKFAARLDDSGAIYDLTAEYQATNVFFVDDSFGKLPDDAHDIFTYHGIDGTGLKMVVRPTAEQSREIERIQWRAHDAKMDAIVEARIKEVEAARKRNDAEVDKFWSTPNPKE